VVFTEQLDQPKNILLTTASQILEYKVGFVVYKKDAGQEVNAYNSLYF